ncbi:Thromboxane-A synthase [Desmophyllum pertusum]|uniref:Thromboxane-A synthase n=1 Tax=Desmophyllum pertusum TaxID=174260 RepID=A0A9X0A2B0_9CNID|nr:Thromboxane-A synthase [Desmophyllum pertusum]
MIKEILVKEFTKFHDRRMMSFMNEALNTLIQKVDKISKTGEIVDFHRWLQSLTMEVIFSTAFGIKAETQTVENDPITELAKKAMAPPHLLTGILFLLPFGEHIMKYLPDPFNFDKICSIAANIITERTKANDNSKVHNHFKRLSCSDRFTEAFMPFVFGPHNCVGMRFALLEIKLTLVRLLKKHKLERTEKTAVAMDFVVSFVLTCSPGKVMLKVSPRE